MNKTAFETEDVPACVLSLEFRDGDRHEHHLRVHGRDKRR